ncbi:rRNA maturation RNase YbeY [Candidatus Gottesmanbacteria bacterium]|nr:rRNA maturation RNase YbeY [Candidatus Gottesmanbacteria bacterium]
MISVLFQTESHFPVGRKKVIDAVTDVLGGKVKGKTEVGISVVGDRQMRQLNKKYRNVGDTTDVLSFGINEAQDNGPFVDPPDGILRLGDIVISYPQAVAGAAEENKLVDDKIIELVLHGLNHLLGIHHPE